jgi:hypothetical protein
MEKGYLSSVVNNGEQVIADLFPTLFSAFTRGDFLASTPRNVPCHFKSNGCSAAAYGSSTRVARAKLHKKIPAQL